MPLLKFSRTTDRTVDKLRRELEGKGFVVLSIQAVGEYIWVDVEEAQNSFCEAICAEHGVNYGEGESGPHTHPISDVVNLTSTLAGKVATTDQRLSDARTPLEHTHSEYVLGSDLIVALDGLAGDIAEKADSDDPRFTDARTPLAHSHVQSDITGLSTALSNKVDTNDSRLSDARTALPHSHPQSDITGLSAALSGKQATSERGQANGYASLGADGLVPSSQLPASGPGAGISGKTISLLNPNDATSAAATNLAANTFNAVQDPAYRQFHDLRALTKVRIQGRLGGTVVAATRLRIQYHLGGNPAVATGDGGWATFAESAGSHTVNTMFYSAEIAIPVGARVNDVLLRVGIFGGDGVADPTITCAILNVYL